MPYDFSAKEPVENTPISATLTLPDGQVIKMPAALSADQWRPLPTWLASLSSPSRQPREFEPPPAIKIEAADELQRMEYQLTLHKNFLVSKGLFVEFVKWVG